MFKLFFNVGEDITNFTETFCAGCNGIAVHGCGFAAATFGLIICFAAGALIYAILVRLGDRNFGPVNTFFSRARRAATTEQGSVEFREGPFRRATYPGLRKL